MSKQVVDKILNGADVRKTIYEVISFDPIRNKVKNVNPEFLDRIINSLVDALNEEFPDVGFKRLKEQDSVTQGSYFSKYDYHVPGFDETNYWNLFIIGFDNADVAREFKIPIKEFVSSYSEDNIRDLTCSVARFEKTKMRVFCNRKHVHHDGPVERRREDFEKFLSKQATLFLHANHIFPDDYTVSISVYEEGSIISVWVRKNKNNLDSDYDLTAVRLKDNQGGYEFLDPKIEKSFIDFLNSKIEKSEFSELGSIEGILYINFI